MSDIKDKEAAHEAKLLALNKNTCRMYENQYPEVEDFVLVKVQTVQDMGAYVTLMEYDNIEGMILLSELSRRRIRSINKLIRAGRTEVAVVLRVDKDKGYIDLSKRRVSAEDIRKCEEKFSKSKTVHAIMRHVAEKSGIKMVELYEKFGWDLYKRFGHAYDAFKLIINKSEEVLKPYELKDDVKGQLMAQINRRLTPQAIKIRADIEVTCFSYEGIKAIQEALKAGEETGTADCPIKIKLVAPPLYVMMATSLDKDAGIKLLEDACQNITDTIKAKEGNVSIKVAARAVTEVDDKLLATLMETLDKQNAEVDGDDEDQE